MSKCLLIVDDNSDLRLMLRRMFESDGYVVEEAAERQFGLKLAAKLHPDTILLSIVPPLHETAEAVRAFREVAPTAYLVVAWSPSGSDDLDPLELAGRAGADSVLRKPFMPRELLKLAQQRSPGASIPGRQESTG
jgi:CheY-like chemotaxis protein